VRFYDQLPCWGGAHANTLVSGGATVANRLATARAVIITLTCLPIQPSVQWQQSQGKPLAKEECKVPELFRSQVAPKEPSELRHVPARK
jgi:hypothetical protein